MAIVNFQHSITINSEGVLEGGNPSAPVASGHIDLSMELSKLYGKNIRQGQTFKVKGIQASMKAANSEYDVGISTMTRFAYCPSTKHTRKAWNMAYPTWMAQKKLRSGAMFGTRYDDLEYAYNVDHNSSRTSTLRQGGLADADEDKMYIYGNSNESSNVFALSDFYEQLKRPLPPSRYSAGEQVVKEAKFDDLFATQRYVSVASNASAMGWQDEIEIPVIGELFGVKVQGTALGGTHMSADIHQFPESLNVLCGLMEYDVYAIPDDTVFQNQDNALIYFSVWVESFTPIRSYNRRGRANKRGKSYSRGRRFSGRRYRRRK